MKGKLLLAHWDAATCAALAEELAAAGWEVDAESDDGGAAYNRMKANPPDVVVIYLDHKPTHGIETGVAIRGSASLGDTPLIFVNGDQAAESKARARISYAIYIPEEKLPRTLAYFELR